jgi:hypothetical protein
LLPQGSRWSNWILGTVSSQAVQSLPVADAVAARLEPSADSQQCEAELQRLFRKFGDAPADRLFRDAVVRHRLGRQT